MSLNGVWRVRFEDASLIVKAGPSPTEALFYERVAPKLRQAGVPIPDLYFSLHEPEQYWLLIEDIPTPLPVPAPDRWQPDGRIIATLARLHATTRTEPPDLPDVPLHHWYPDMTQATLDCLPPDNATALAPILERLQQEHASFNEHWSWISGDPNPRNWGLRDDGTPVLYDWELVAPGVPATDLAIVIPGLGSPAAYASVAAAYLAVWNDHGRLPWDAATLTHQIAVAKVATVAQLLHGRVSGSANVGDEIVNWLASAVPDWLRTLHDLWATTSGSS